MSNRKHRRALASQERKQEHTKLVDETLRDQDDLVAGCEWTQEMDPEDPRFALISMRIPVQKLNTQELNGAAASERIGEFIRGFLQAIMAATEEVARRAQAEREVPTKSKLLL